MIKYTIELHNIIKSKVHSDCEIVCVFQTGSGLLLSLYRDVDLIVLINNYKVVKERRYDHMNLESFDFNGKHYDCFFVDTQDFFHKTCPRTFHCISLLMAIQDSKFVYFGAIPEEYKQIDWRERLINILRKRYTEFLETEKIQIPMNKRNHRFVIEKVFYWDWFLVCILHNGSLSFTTEQLYIGQQIHDNMTSTYVADKWKALAEDILFN